MEINIEYPTWVRSIDDSENIMQFKTSSSIRKIILQFKEVSIYDIFRVYVNDEIPVNPPPPPPPPSKLDANIVGANDASIDTNQHEYYDIKNLSIAGDDGQFVLNLYTSIPADSQVLVVKSMLQAYRVSSFDSNAKFSIQALEAEFNQIIKTQNYILDMLHLCVWRPTSEIQLGYNNNLAFFHKINEEDNEI